MDVSPHVAMGNDMSEILVLLAIGVCMSSGAPGLFFNRHSIIGQYVSTLLAVFGATLGIAGAAVFWLSADSCPISLAWPIPGAEFNVAIDGLSAIFLLPVFLISLLANVYGLEYWKQTDHPENGRKLRFFYGILTAGMALLVIARNGILFLVGWEVMALSAFFLVTTEDHDWEVRESGWIYLVATHVATLCLFALFALLRAVSGSFTLAPLRDHLSPAVSTAIFALALVGFGLKAGIMPFHVWLPGAHASAPSHVSAIMSGVIIKMGIYGLVRITSLIPDPPVEWGGIVLALGIVSGVLGVAFAVGQHDLKRLLAYHSIENIGIIVIGLGVALLGRSQSRLDWIVLGLSGTLLHVWNHALFKSLLFLSAGAVIHATHTREIDHLGGLTKKMPRTAVFFLVGAAAICGLPPLNGFVSEFLIYLGLFATLHDANRPLLLLGAFAVPALALIGALAAACFVKVFGAVFLGTARSEHAREAHDAPNTMSGPMSVLVGCCTVIGVLPFVVAPLLDQGVMAWAPELQEQPTQLAVLVPLWRVSSMSMLLLFTVGLGALGFAMRLRNGPCNEGITWGCGYIAPIPRMQYTSSSFAQMLVDFFSWALRPRTKKPSPLPLFPGTASFHSEVPETVLEEAVLPTFRFTAWALTWFRVFQQGSIQAYLLYIFLALLALLLWQ